MFRNYGKRILFCGPSGSGKTYIAKALRNHLLSKGYAAVLLDGDDVRNTISSGLSFTDNDIIENMKRIGDVTKLLQHYNHIDYVIASVICPIKEARMLLTKYYGFDNAYFVNRPECYDLDLKGLYKSGKQHKFEPINDSEGIKIIQNRTTDGLKVTAEFLDSLISNESIHSS